MDKYLKYLSENIVNDDSLKYIGRHNDTRDDVPKDQLEMGIEVEMEHVANGTPKAIAREIATRIALDHISENSQYYSLLKKFVESKNDGPEDKWRG